MAWTLRHSESLVTGSNRPGRRCPFSHSAGCSTGENRGNVGSLLTMIELGTKHFHSEAVGNSIAFTTFAFCLIVAALECRSETGTILTTATFDSKQMNRALIVEVILAVLITQMDALRRLLDTTDLNVREFGWALVPAVGLFILWELGKVLARHYADAPLPAPDVLPGGAGA